MQSLKKTELMAGLRAQIAALETPSVKEAELCFQLGLEEVDGQLPGGGLARRGVHEVRAASYGDMGAAIGFGAGLATRAAYDTPNKDRLIVWCQQSWGTYDLGTLYAPGLAAFGIDPSRLLLVNPAREPDMLWALEECVRAGVFAAVVGEVPASSRHFNLRASRRLHLAAEDTGTPLILMRGFGELSSPSAALTRWCVSAASTVEEGSLHAINRPGWRVDLEKCKGGRPFVSGLAWDAGAGAFVSSQQRYWAQPEEPRAMASVTMGSFLLDEAS
jgi:protein ImuA